MSFPAGRARSTSGVVGMLVVLLIVTGCDRDDLDYAVGTIERYRIDLARVVAPIGQEDHDL